MIDDAYTDPASLLALYRFGRGSFFVGLGEDGEARPEGTDGAATQDTPLPNLFPQNGELVPRWRIDPEILPEFDIEENDF